MLCRLAGRGSGGWAPRLSYRQGQGKGRMHVWMEQGEAQEVEGRVPCLAVTGEGRRLLGLSRVGVGSADQCRSADVLKGQSRCRRETRPGLNSSSRAPVGPRQLGEDF